jgi:hypothetical protein
MGGQVFHMRLPSCAVVREFGEGDAALLDDEAGLAMFGVRVASMTVSSRVYGLELADAVIGLLPEPGISPDPDEEKRCDLWVSDQNSIAR